MTSLCASRRRRKRMTMAGAYRTCAVDCLWISCAQQVKSAGRRSLRRAGGAFFLGRDDLGLDGLVLRVGDELLIEQLLRLAQPPHRIALGGHRPRRRSNPGAHLDAPRARPQLLELADAALLAPGLVLGLTDAVDRLCLRAALPVRRGRRDRSPCRRAASGGRSECPRAASLPRDPASGWWPRRSRRTGGG